METLVSTKPRTEVPETVLLPLAALLAAVLLWGGSFAAMRTALMALPPAAVMACRMWIAALLLLPLAGRLRRLDYRPGDWRMLAPMVLLQPCLYFLLESHALRLTTSSQAGVISASVPLWVALAAWALLGERLHPFALAGLLISVSGVAGLTFLAGPVGGGANPFLGNLLEVGAMACAAANMVLVKRLSRRYSPWVLTAFQVAAGALFFLPGLTLLAGGGGVRWAGGLVAALLFLGGGVTLGAFGLYNWALSRIPASRAAAFINLVPVVAVAIGWLLMEEPLSPLQCLAALVVAGGVGLSQAR